MWIDARTEPLVPTPDYAHQCLLDSTRGSMGCLPFRFRNLEWIGDSVALSPPDAPELDLGALIAFPGLVNSHDHLEFNCYPPIGRPPYREFLEWGHDVLSHKDLVARVEAIPKALRRQAGVLKNLLWGVTAVSDHTDAPDSVGPIRILDDFDFIHSPEAGRKRRRILLNCRRQRPVVLHLGEGVTAGSRDRARTLLRWNLFGRRIVGVHGVSLQPPDFAHLAALVWCPASNDFLFGRTANVTSAKARLPILFGTDSTLSAPGTLWDHLRLARGAGLSDAELFAAVTTQARLTWCMTANQDFVVCRRRHADPLNAFYAIEPRDIILVVSQGEVVLADVCLGHAFAGLEPACAGKLVKMPVEMMLAELNHYIDADAMLARYITG